MYQVNGKYYLIYRCMRRGVCEVLCGDLDELEQQAEGDPGELEQQADGDPDELEQQTEGDPDELEQQAEGDPDEPEQQADGDPDELEQQAEGDSDEPEQQAEGDPDELEQQAEGDPDELEQQAEGDPDELEQPETEGHTGDLIHNDPSDHIIFKNGVGHGDIGGSYHTEADTTNGNTQLEHANGHNSDSSERDQYDDNFED